SRQIPMELMVPEAEDAVIRLTDPLTEASIPEGGSYTLTASTMSHRIRTTQYAALHLAVIHSTYQVLRELLNTEGVDINITDEQRRTPLHFAVVTNRRSVIQLLVELGCNIDVQGCSGRTPLLAAVTSDQLDCARMLIGLGADLNLTGNNGTTPLYHMCSHKKPRDDNGMTAIEFCVGHKTRLSSLLLCLIHNGADINIIDRKGRTLLDIAIEKMVLTNIVALLLADVHRDAAIMQQENILYLCDRLPEFKAWIIEEIHTPRSLKRLSRGYIRGQLGPEGLVRASSLDLPRVLQDFLLCRDIGPKDLEPYSTAFLSLTLLVMPQ
ncbi:ANKR7-like protein, partial [Mya arenaria]